MNANERDVIRRHGFLIHYVPLGGSDGCQYVNAHTHGVPESVGSDQLDWQVVVGIGTGAVHALFHDLYGRARAGERFRDGDRVEVFTTGRLAAAARREGMRVGLPVRFQAARDGREVLRVLLPDASYVLPGDEGHDPAWYPHQLGLDTDADTFPWGRAPGCGEVPECSRKEGGRP